MKRRTHPTHADRIDAFGAYNQRDNRRHNAQRDRGVGSDHQCEGLYTYSDQGTPCTNQLARKIDGLVIAGADGHKIRRKLGRTQVVIKTAKV